MEANETFEEAKGKYDTKSTSHKNNSAFRTGLFSTNALVDFASNGIAGFLTLGFPCALHFRLIPPMQASDCSSVPLQLARWRQHGLNVANTEHWLVESPS